MIGPREDQGSVPEAVGITLPRHIRIGEFVIMESVAGKVWIQNCDGEGMETSAAKLEVYLKGLWNAEF